MRTVYKYVFPPDLSAIELKDVLAPTSVHVGLDPATHQVAVWVDQYTEQPESVHYAPVHIQLWVVGTGHEVSEKGWHIGSVIDGSFVWHVYWRRIA